MTAIRNVSPRGDLDVPLLGRIVAAGEVVDVDPAHAEILLEQVDNWQPAADGGIVPIQAAATAEPEPVVAPDAADNPA